MCLHFESIQYWNWIPKHTSNPRKEFFLFFSFLIWNKLKVSSAPHSCANVSDENQSASWSGEATAFFFILAHMHTVFITILPVSEGKLQESSVLALGFPLVRLTCKQHNSRNHHNYKTWSVLWIALATKTMIAHMTRRERDASVKIGRPHGVDLGFSIWGARKWASMLLTHSYNKSWN